MSDNNKLNIKNIPEELIKRDKWVCWRFVVKNDKPTKMPINPHTGRPGSVTDPNTWGTYSEAHAAFQQEMYDGIGFVLTKDDPYTGIDLDKCRNAETGVIEPEAMKIIERMDSYTEITPSERGVRIWVKAVLPDGASNRTPGVEIYDRRRFFTISGNHIPETPLTIEDRQSELDELHSSIFHEPEKKPLDPLLSVQAPLGESDIIENIASRLWSGDSSGYPSPSEADIALCGIIAPITSYDAEKIDRVFRQSGLYKNQGRAEKWNKGHYANGETYGQHTIATAIGNARKNRGSSSQEKKEEIQRKAFEIIKEALDNSHPTEFIFSNQKHLSLLALVRQRDTAGWAIIKERVRGKINLNDLEKAVKEHSPQLEKKINNGGSMPKLLEDSDQCCYYKWKNRIQDNGVRASERVEISNFIFLPKERLTVPDKGEVVIVDALVKDKNPRKLEFLYSDLIFRRDLLNAIPTTEITFTGTDDDVQRVRSLMMKHEAVKKKGVTVAGRHGQYIVLPKLTLSQEGPLKNPPIQFVLHKDILLRSIPSKWPSADAQAETNRAVFALLPWINEANVIALCIGWLFALPWCQMIREAQGWGGFPHLILSGPAGSGKTETGRLLWRLNGIPRSMDPFALPRTPFTRLSGYSTTNLVPLFMDEYKPGNWKNTEVSNIHHELRSLYGGELNERGTRTLKVCEYPLIAPVIIAGEDRPRDPALNDRVITAVFNPDVVEGRLEVQVAFDAIQKAPLEAFALPFWAWSLSYEGWINDLKKERERIIDWGKGKNLSIPNRIINNLSIISFGWTVFKRYANYLNLNIGTFLDGGDLDSALESALSQVLQKGQSRNAFDELMLFIEGMVGNEKLEYGIHFTMKNNDSIVLRLKNVLPEMNKYARETSYKGDILGEAAYRDMLNAMVGQKDSYVKHMQGRGDFERHDNDRNVLRGILIDVSILEERLGIDAEIWKKPTTNTMKQPVSIDKE